ncbi:MAG: ParB/RepB/Spo0J family partition protein [Candidatus Dormibacteraceae bacterium]
MKRPRSRGLGRGLEALIPIPAGGAAGASELIDVDQIVPSQEQVRRRFEAEPLRELADSIRAHGLLQPVLVRRREHGYELIAGERRWRAARMAGLDRIPAVVRGGESEEETGQRESLILGLIENLQRTDLDPIEEARGIRRLIDQFGLTHEEAAERLGRHRVAVTQALRILTAAPAVISATAAGAISAGHARVLATMPDHPSQEHGLKVILGRNLTVRQTEKLVRASKPRPAPTSTRWQPAETALDDLRRQLQDRYGEALRVEGTPRRGRIVMSWATTEDRAGLVRALLK